MTTVSRKNQNSSAVIVSIFSFIKASGDGGEVSHSSVDKDLELNNFSAPASQDMLTTFFDLFLYSFCLFTFVQLQ